MGRARIVENVGDGLYSVILLEQDLELRTLKKEVKDLRDKVTAQESVVSNAEDDYEAEVDALSALLAAGATHDQIQAQRHKCNMAQAEYSRTVAQLNALKIALAIAEKKYDDFQDDGEELTPVVAWCADYSVHLSGEVDTIEIDGDTRRTGRRDIIIAPGGVAPIIPDTIALTVPAHSSTQAYFNWAVFPAWQRWMPTYREGIIEAMFQDPEGIGPWYARVKIVPSVSKAQGLTITPRAPGYDPPEEETEDQKIKREGEDNRQMLPEKYTFDYMSCDYKAFTPGDRVVVAWPNRDWTEGVIIGFIEQPRPCDWHEQVMFRIGDMVSVYCPENNFVVLPPTPYMGPRYMEWYSRTIGALNVESPYDTVSYVLPNVLTTNPVWYDMSVDTRVPVRKFCDLDGLQPMSGEINLSDVDTECYFTAKMGNFIHSPAGFINADNVGEIGSRPSPSYDGETYAAYDTCKRYRASGSPLTWVEVDWEESREAIYEHVWDYKHLGAYLMITRGLPSWFEACWSLRMYNAEQGEITVRQEFDQTVDLHAWTNYDDADPPGPGEWSEKAAEYHYHMQNTWNYYSIGSQSKSGSFDAETIRAYGVASKDVLSYDWIGWGLRNTMRSGSTIVQSFIHEAGHYEGSLEAGTFGDIEVWVPATCDFILYQAMETPGYNRSHNLSFSNFLKDLYQAVRVHYGYAQNVPMNWMTLTRTAGIYAYVPEEGAVYPSVIGVPDPEPEEEEEE